MNNEKELQWMISAWESAKREEKAAVETRRHIEDSMAALLGIAPDLDGTINVEAGDSVIKIVGRLSYKVSSEVLDDIIRENGVEEVAHTVFRFRPELNVRAWKQADEDTQNLFSDAITTSAGRPSFAITAKE